MGADAEERYLSVPVIQKGPFGEQMRDNRNPSPDVGLGAGVLALIAMIAFAALIFAGLHWNGPHLAGSITAQGTTVGISTGRQNASIPN